MNATACRVESETRQHHQRINVADVYRNMVTDQVRDKFPKSLAVTDALYEIHGDDYQTQLADAINQIGASESPCKALSAWISGLSNELIDIRVERGE